MCIVFHKTVAPTFRGFDSLAVSNLCVTDFALRHNLKAALSGDHQQERMQNKSIIVQ